MNSKDMVYQSAQTPKPASQTADALFNNSNVDPIRDAFQLGWSILELKYRVLSAPDQFILQNSSPTSIPADDILTSHESIMIDTVLKEAVSKELINYPEVSLMKDSTSFPRVWRTLFNHIANLHSNSLPDSSTELTIYDIPTPGSHQPLPYPFLYPAGGSDYADFGLNQSRSPSLEKFKLYDVTRRALNCLILMYTDPKDSPIPKIVGEYQKQIIKNVRSNRPSSDKQAAIKILSGLTASLLTAWEGYLRENIYLDGRAKDNEVMLRAYEAGRALASLLWSISLLTLPKEYADGASAATSQKNEQIKQDIYAAWKKVFNSDNISSIRQQISPLSSPFDDAYCQSNKTDRQSAELNFYLPSQAINAIKDSLNYWQQVVQWISNHTENISSSPMPGNDISRQFRNALTQQLDNWKSLLLGYESLTSSTNKNVTKAIYNNFVRDFNDAVNAQLLETVNAKNKTLKIRNRTLAFVIVLVVLLLIVLLVPLPGLNKTLFSIFISSATIFVGFSGSLVDVLNKFISFFKTKSDTEDANAEKNKERFADVYGLSHAVIKNAFTDGDDRILSKYNYLNYSVAISQPLVEFVKANTQNITLTDDYDFLAQIIWSESDDEKEIERAVRTFFGSVGTFVGTQEMKETTAVAIK